MSGLVEGDAFWSDPEGVVALGGRDRSNGFEY